jgi:[acyl-carrier-protein] S-malonyltransferase
MMNTAFIFPGQGSQSVGMLSDLLPQYPIVVELFAEASEVFGHDLWRLIQNGPLEQLNQTQYTQVAMLTADVAVYKIVMNAGVPQPQIMAGHSLGEYAALVCANALTLTEAVRLVASRGRLMQESVPLGVGSMAAIVGLSDEQVKQICIQSSEPGEQVSPANYNAIGQVVIAGHTPAVHRAIALAEEFNAFLAKQIPVSVPCHCPLLTEAAEQFEAHLAAASFKSPAIDVISNVDLSIYYSPQHIREQLKKQLYSPVRWVETIHLFKERGVNQVVECGPGRVLSGLVKRIERDLNTVSVHDTSSLERLFEQIHSAA